MLPCSWNLVKSMLLAISVAAANMPWEHCRAALIGVDFDLPGGSFPNNWNQFEATSIPAFASNLRDEAGNVTEIDLAITRVGNVRGTTLATPTANTLPTHTQSLAGLSGFTYAYGSSIPGSMTFQWQSLLAGRTYHIYFFGLTDATIGAANHVAVTGNGGPISFDQGLIPQNLWVNGGIGTTAPLDSFALVIVADTSGHITIQATPIVTGGAVGVAGLAISELPPVALAGDYNADARVDAADYTVWRDHLGLVFNLNGNGDETGGSAGFVDQADYAYWKLHFGEAAGSGSLTNDPVPEPTTLALAALGFVAGLLNLSRRTGC